MKSTRNGSRNMILMKRIKIQENQNLKKPRKIRRKKLKERKLKETERRKINLRKRNKRTRKAAKRMIKKIKRTITKRKEKAKAKDDDKLLPNIFSLIIDN